MSTTKLTGPLVLREDVLITPVDKLRPEVRAQIDCADDDFAVSRPMSRVPSSVVDPDSAALLERFREPTTIVEAVILFSRERKLDPNELLEDAYPLIRRFLANRFLVPADEAEEGGLQPSFAAGELVRKEWTVVRTLYQLEDTELFQVRRRDGDWAVLKIERPGQSVLAGSFEREAAALRRLEGRIAPRLLDQGELDGRRYLLLEWCPGVDAETACAEWRGRSGAGARRRLLALCREVVAAYVELHAAGLLHGDVHPLNTLVDRRGRVRLVDFGLAASVASNGNPAPRGGVAFFFDPEYARALLGEGPPPAATPLGEQYSLATLLYSLVTGTQYLDFSLEREQMLRQIAESPPLPFAERGLEPWPELETILGRALAKDPARRYPSLEALAAALQAVPLPEAEDPPAQPMPPGSELAQVRDQLVHEAGPEGAWLEPGLEPAPTASITYGAAGLGHGLARIAALRAMPEVLAQADIWTSRAAGKIGQDEGFYSTEIDITREVVGEASPYHTASGVFAVQAQIARANDDPYTQGAALEAFVEASAAPAQGLDLTLGRCSTLLACSLLLDGVAGGGPFDRSRLRELGDRVGAEVWEALAAKPAIAEADVDYLGIAHGWAGFLYALLQWSRASGSPPPSGIDERLRQLAAFAEPTGRGVRWPWNVQPDASGQHQYMAGWCNGSAGYVFLWTLAARQLGEPSYLELAEGAAWDAWDAPDPYPSLCCGLAGRSYALLNLYKQTESPDWLRRARALGERAARELHRLDEYPHSLYKGKLAVAVLAADLEHPLAAAQPFFEEEGWPPAD